MNRLLWGVALVGITLAFTAVEADAQTFGQPYSPRARPGLSPYLNLLRGGNPAANYYMGVVPEVNQRAINRQFGTAIQDLERESILSTNPELEDLLPELPVTGHGAGFMNFAPYYNFGGPAARGGSATYRPQPSRRGR